MKQKQRYNFKKKVLAKWQLYVLMFPAVLYTLLFSYKPMYGILIAFQNFSVRKGVWGSEWVGFDQFEREYPKDCVNLQIDVR